MRAPTPSAAAELVCPSKAELCEFFDGAKTRLSALLKGNLEAKKVKLTQLKNSYAFSKFSDTLLSRRQYTDSLLSDAAIALKDIATGKRSRVLTLASKLDAMSPLKVLCRGYSIAEGKDAKIIKSVADVKSGNEFTLRLSDGTAKGKFI